MAQYSHTAGNPVRAGLIPGDTRHRLIGRQPVSRGEDTLYTMQGHAGDRLIASSPPVQSEPCLTLGPAAGLLIGGTIRQLANWAISGSSTESLTGGH